MKSWPLLVLALVFALCAWLLFGSGPGDRSKGGPGPTGGAPEDSKGGPGPTGGAPEDSKGGPGGGSLPAGEGVGRDDVTAADAAARPLEADFAGPAARLRVRLVAGDGEPAEGAEVELDYRRRGSEAQPAFDAEAWEERDPAVADADGWVDVPLPAQARFLVWLGGPHWRTVSRDLQPLAPAEVADLGEIALSPAVRLHGVIADAQGRPVADARVDIEEDGRVGFWGRGWRHSTRSEADGTWELPGVPPGRYVVNAVAQGHMLTELRGVRVEAEPRDRAIEITLQPGEEVTGYVVDTDDRPVGGAEIFVLAVPQGQFWGDSKPPIPDDVEPAATADDRGFFRVGGVDPDDPPFVAARAPGYEPAYVEPYGAGRELLLRMEPHTALTGRVLGPLGDPVADATVRLTEERRWGGTRDLESVETDGEGRFALQPREPGDYRLSAESAEGDLAATRELTLGVRPEPVELRLEPRTALTVLVTDDAGAPVEDARVTISRPAQRPELGALEFQVRGASLQDLNGSGGRRWRERSDAQGVARFHALPADRYELSVRARGRAPHEEEFTRSDADQELEVELQRGAALRVRLLDEAGAPVPGIPVALRHAATGDETPELESDALGRAVWDGLAPGAYHVAYRANAAQGWWWGDDEDEAALDHPQVALAAGADEELTITVRDLAITNVVVLRGGVRAAGVPVRLEEVREDGRYGWNDGFQGAPVTDGRGEVRLDPVEAGTYALVVKPGRSAPENRQQVDLVPGTQTVTVEIHGGAVEGQLFGMGGALAGARVSLRPHQPEAEEDGPQRRGMAVIAISDSDGNVQVQFGHGDENATNATTDADGRYRFEDVPPGRWIVSANADDHGTWTSLPFETRGQGVRDLGSARLLAGAVIHGRDRNHEPDDEPGTGFSFGDAVQLLDAEGNMMSISQIDAEGRFRFEDLAEGEYRLRKDRWTSEPIELRAGAEKRVDVPVEARDEDRPEDR